MQNHSLPAALGTLTLDPSLRESFDAMLDALNSSIESAQVELHAAQQARAVAAAQPMHGSNGAAHPGSAAHEPSGSDAMCASPPATLMYNGTHSVFVAVWLVLGTVLFSGFLLNPAGHSVLQKRMRL